MIERSRLEQIRKQFESDPSLLKRDDKFTQLFHVARMVENVDVSIKALDAIVESGNPSCLYNLKSAWDVFLENAELPEHG